MCLLIDTYINSIIASCHRRLADKADIEEFYIMSNSLPYSDILQEVLCNKSHGILTSLTVSCRCGYIFRCRFPASEDGYPQPFRRRSWRGRFPPVVYCGRNLCSRLLEQRVPTSERELQEKLHVVCWTVWERAERF